MSATRLYLRVRIMAALLVIIPGLCYIWFAQHENNNDSDRTEPETVAVPLPEDKHSAESIDDEQAEPELRPIAREDLLVKPRRVIDTDSNRVLMERFYLEDNARNILEVPKRTDESERFYYDKIIELPNVEFPNESKYDKYYDAPIGGRDELTLDGDVDFGIEPELLVLPSESERP